MPLECERRFLARLHRPGDVQKHILQGYFTLPNDPYSVRVRLCGSMAELTVKGEDTGDGVVSVRVEENIPLAEELARQFYMLAPGRVEKIRHVLGDWEVDVFLGDYEGIVIAEVELPTAQTLLPPVPDSLELLIEITGNKEWNNQAMAYHAAAERSRLVQEAKMAGCCVEI